MSRRLLVLAVAALAASPQPGRAQGDGAAAVAKIDALFASFAVPGSPGCAVSVTRDGELLFAGGYGSADLEHDVPITPATAFNAASVAKQFTAATVAVLAGQGRLSLDDDVRRFVPEVPDFGPRLTLRHLLHHTSGLRDYRNVLALGGWPSDGPITGGDFLDVVGRQESLSFPPGQEHSYSNTGYVLLALVAERAGGLPLSELAAASLFRPLGMTGTAFRDDHTALVRGRAVGYQPRAGGGYRVSQPNADVVGDSGLFTSVLDLARWDPGELDRRLGVPGVTATLTSPGRLASGEDLEYAGGLAVGAYRELRTWAMAGWSGGYRAYLIRFPDQRFGVSTLCNVNTADPVALSRRVADVYLADRFPPEVPAPPPSAAAAASPSGEPPPFAGVYWSPELQDYRRVVLREGALHLVPDSALGPPVRLTPLADGRFQAGDPTRTLTFHPAEAGGMRLEDSQPGETRRFDRLPADRPPAPASDYRGTYASDELLDGRWTLAARDGRLFVRRRHVPDLSLEPLSGDAFLLGGSVVRFTRDPQGRVTGLTVKSGRLGEVRFSKVPDP